MDWYLFAKNDWEVYHNSSRVQKYVQFGKISAEQYQEITGEPYVA